MPFDTAHRLTLLIMFWSVFSAVARLRERGRQHTVMQERPVSSEAKNAWVNVRAPRKVWGESERKKCEFFQPSVEFCGHKISQNGLHRNQDKVDAVINAPRPTCVKELQSFIGLVTYYHKFLPNVATLLKPLYELTKKTPNSFGESHSKKLSIARSVK